MLRGGTNNVTLEIGIAHDGHNKKTYKIFHSPSILF